jgi:hypothetical protein
MLKGLGTRLLRIHKIQRVSRRFLLFEVTYAATLKMRRIALKHITIDTALLLAYNFERRIFLDGGGGVYKVRALRSFYSFSSSLRKTYESLELGVLLKFELRPVINIANRTM